MNLNQLVFIFKQNITCSKYKRLTLPLSDPVDFSILYYKKGEKIECFILCIMFYNLNNVLYQATYSSAIHTEFVKH